MRFFTRTHQIPLRLATGAFFLHSGLSKAEADEPTAAGVHGMASNTYPFLSKLDPQRFTRLLSKAEIALGTALLIPVVPPLLAGAAVTAFAGGLIGLYLKTPGMREEGSIRPTQQGLPVAKDIWLLGIGLSLVLEELADRQAHLRPVIVAER
jgi:uncharacterized membrane protein YphA (DoxX/SURF4 family)